MFSVLIKPASYIKVLLMLDIKDLITEEQPQISIFETFLRSSGADRWGGLHASRQTVTCCFHVICRHERNALYLRTAYQQVTQDLRVHIKPQNAISKHTKGNN